MAAALALHTHLARVADGDAQRLDDVGVGVAALHEAQVAADDLFLRVP